VLWQSLLFIHQSSAGTAAAMGDVEFEPNDDEMLDLDGAEAQPPPRLRSKVTAVKKQKGRGFGGATDPDAPPDRHAGRYESLETGTGPGPQKCARMPAAACSDHCSITCT
jgi:RNA-binding protein 8A